MTAERATAAWRRRLYLPAYRVADAARYAGVASQTILNWQNSSGPVRGAISPRNKGEQLSYMQLVEVAFVSALRKSGVRLEDIKNARDYIATKLSAEYPFATQRFKTDGKDIIMELAEFVDGESRRKLVKVNKGGQLAWADIIDTKFTEFEYQDGLAVKWHVGGRNTHVLIDPRLSFGAPTVGGIATWAIKGRWEAGESIEDIAEDFGLKPADVGHALKFEGVKTAEQAIH